MARAWRSLFVITIAAGTAACGADDNLGPQPLLSSETANAGDGPTIVADPQVAQPGQLVDLWFPTQISRGVHWYMSRLEEGEWSKPLYLITAKAGNYNYDTLPSWIALPAEIEGHDIGIRGPGPDKVVIPNTARPGEYKLCMANTNESHCVRIKVFSVE